MEYFEFIDRDLLDSECHTELIECCLIVIGNERGNI